MKSKPNLILMLLLMILTAESCDRPNCENTNPIFNQYDMNSEEYTTELLSQIKEIGQDNLTYWFSSYEEENGNEYIMVHIQNDSLCAKGMIKVDNWGEIEGIKRTKGKGYVGAELRGLTFTIEKDSSKTEFVYKDLARIID